MKIRSKAPSMRYTTLPEHEHAARRARAKTVALPRKVKPTPPAKPALSPTHPPAQPHNGNSQL